LNQPFEGKKEIYIVDNGSDNPQTIAYYQEVSQQQNIAIIPYPEPFNYSEAINRGVQETKSDLVLLMNDDMAVFTDIWLNELAQWAVRPEIGVVGAKLIRKNHTIQHAGIVMGLSGFAGHIYLNAPEDYHGLLGSVDWTRNYLAMTGACQMVRREVFNDVGGYDEGYRLAFGDIDFCLKVHEKGYQNVYTPFAQLYHYEGSSRGYQTPVEDALKGYDTLETYLINEDPFFSPNLTYTRIPRCVFKKHTVNERKQQIEARKNFYLQPKPP
jgi:GT2 family glycosyltransferase